MESAVFLDELPVVDQDPRVTAALLENMLLEDILPQLEQLKAINHQNSTATGAATSTTTTTTNSGGGERAAHLSNTSSSSYESAKETAARETFQLYLREVIQHCKAMQRNAIQKKEFVRLSKARETHWDTNLEVGAVNHKSNNNHHVPLSHIISQLQGQVVHSGAYSCGEDLSLSGGAIGYRHELIKTRLEKVSPLAARVSATNAAMKYLDERPHLDRASKWLKVRMAEGVVHVCVFPPRSSSEGRVVTSTEKGTIRRGQAPLEILLTLGGGGRWIIQGVLWNIFGGRSSSSSVEEAKVGEDGGVVNSSGYDGNRRVKYTPIEPQFLAMELERGGFSRSLLAGARDASAILCGFISEVLLRQIISFVQELGGDDCGLQLLEPAVTGVGTTASGGVLADGQAQRQWNFFGVSFLYQRASMTFALKEPADGRSHEGFSLLEKVTFPSGTLREEPLKTSLELDFFQDRRLKEGENTIAKIGESESQQGFEIDVRRSVLSWHDRVVQQL